MALDLTGGRRVKVNGLEPSETPMISPPNKSRWNGGDNLSTSKLGMMLSTIQVFTLVNQWTLVLLPV